MRYLNYRKDTAMKKFVKIPLTLLLSFSLISGITVFSGAVSPSTDDAALKVLNEDFAALSENEFEEITSDSENYDVYVLMQFDYPAIDLASLEGLSVEERRETVKKLLQNQKRTDSFRAWYKQCVCIIFRALR